MLDITTLLLLEEMEGIQMESQDYNIMVVVYWSLVEHNQQGVPEGNMQVL